MMEPSIASGGASNRPVPLEFAGPRQGSIDTARGRLTRRDLLVGAGSLFGVAGAGKWFWDDAEHFRRASVFVARVETYGPELVDILHRGLTELGLGRSALRGKSVLLKPNLVEPAVDAPHVNTHPALVRAVVELFHRWDARDVVVAEGQGHCRDTAFVLEQSGLERVLDEDHISFVDLNYDDVFSIDNRLRFTALSKLYLPQALRRADFIVSLPKMKTHHWAGVTLSMKNLFGVMPGVCYGWPKNVLHHAGIGRSILDITAAVRPHLAIVDGVIGMEGDGPIMGQAKPAHVVALGVNLPAVDATCARLMGFDPFRIDYLRNASGVLGPIQERHIEQRGEALSSVAQFFALPDHPHFKQFRGTQSMAPS
ncbi:MAG TPA: DUF362 domain-containing protein [Planctomycetaceae bacterium]|nr:DUF362 domain-containing protein [Planctomycetaceae bacterium]